MGRFLRLLQGPFRKQPTRLALSVCDPPTEANVATDDNVNPPLESQAPLTASSLLQFVTRDDVHRLEQYGRNLVEYSLVLDIVPALAQLFLARRMPEVRLSPLQCAILVAVGCQHHTFDELADEFNTPASQLIALFNKAMHKLGNHCRSLLERQVEDEENLTSRSGTKSGDALSGGRLLKDTLKEEQDVAAGKVNKKLGAAKQELLASLKDEFAIAPGADDIAEALAGQAPTPGLVSVKRKRQNADDSNDATGRHDGGRKKR